MTRSRMILLGSIGLSLLLTASACNKALFPLRFGDRAARVDGDRSDNARNVDRPRADRQDRFAEALPRLAAESQAKPGEPLHAYTNQRIIMIRRPKRYGDEELSRVAVWWTDNNGFYWQKAGYFGREMSSFSFQVEEDGDYGIRFVGPAEEPAQQVLAYPERIYHVDSVRPAIEVAVDPAEDEHHVGDLVAIDWLARDIRLAKYPVRIAALIEAPDSDVRTIEVQRDLAEEGSIGYRIPPEALDRNITFRIEARDRSGNVGLAYSRALSVSPEPAKEDAAAEVAISDASTEDDDRSIATTEQTPTLVIGPLLVPSQADEQEEPAGTIDEPDVELPVEPLAIQAPDVDVQRVADAAAQEPIAPDVVQQDSEAQTLMAQIPAGEEQRADAIALSGSVKRTNNLGAPPLPGVGDGSPGRSIMTATRSATRLKNEMISVASQMITTFDGWWRSAALALAENKPSPIEQRASDLDAETPAVGSDTTDDRTVASSADLPSDAHAQDSMRSGDAAPMFAAGEQAPNEPTADQLAVDAAVEQEVVADAEPSETADVTDGIDAGPTTLATDAGLTLEFGPQILLAEEPSEDGRAFDTDPCDEAEPPSDADTALADAAASGGVTTDLSAPPSRTVRSSPGEVPFASAVARLPSPDARLAWAHTANADDPIGDSAEHQPTPVAVAGQEDSDQQADDANVDVDIETPEVQTLAADTLPGDNTIASATDSDDPQSDDLEDQGDSNVPGDTGYAEIGDESEPILPAWPGGEVTAVDPTRGNGLLIPLPATVEEQAPAAHATAHPWRVLGNATAQLNQAVWTLPQPRPNVDWQPAIQSRFLADNPTMRDVAEPGDTARALAGATEDAVDDEPVEP